jgi:flagellar biosynthesis chaperone FliJ
MTSNEVSHENMLSDSRDAVSVEKIDKQKDVQSKVLNLRIELVQTDHQVCMLDTIIVGLKKEIRMLQAATQSLEETVKNKRAKYFETRERIEQMSVVPE